VLLSFFSGNIEVITENFFLAWGGMKNFIILETPVYMRRQMGENSPEYSSTYTTLNKFRY